ncbi:MAG: cell envelope biogenesis protein LolA [Bradyrhizobium sp.]|nr:MAG: cell envelope biogenesis protein LolA [Bradyrhizobium sp.]
MRSQGPAMQRRTRRRPAPKADPMIWFRSLAWSAAVLLTAMQLAFADDASSDAPPPLPPVRPANLGAPPPDKDAQPAKAATTDDASTPVSGITPEEAVSRANGYLNAARMLTADFVQIGPDGQRSEGQLYVERPGRMLFHFDAPARLEIVADGRTVAVRDQKLDTQDLYFIAQTPLKFLLNNRIDLTKDTSIKRVTIDDNAATIEIEDKATFGGTAEIALVFDPDSFALKQWTVIDAQGFQTVVSLFNIDLTTKPDPDLFHIDQTPVSAAPRR